MKLISIIHRRPGGRRARPVPPLPIAASLALLLPLSFAALASPAAAVAHPGGATRACPWLNQSLPISQRVRLLLSKMTLANEITMVEGQGTGQALRVLPGRAAVVVHPRDGPGRRPARGRRWADRGHPVPAGVSLAATFDTSLARRYGAVIGQEERGKGAAVNLGPTVNILRDPRWGRSFEAFTEDPFLNGALAVSEIRGVQAQGEMSQVKHFAAYNQETNRNTPADDVIVSNRTLHEIYLPAFQQAVTQARAASVMCGFSMVNGDFACDNRVLETQILKQRWGFPGFVTSDYGALHATQGAVDGTDMEQPFNIFFGQALQTDVQDGTIPRSVVDNMVSRIAAEMFRFGIFNNPPTGTTGATVTTPAHQAVSEQVAEDGTVLLKNGHGVLPLRAAHAGTLAVIGPAASAAPADTGGGSAFVTAPFSVTPLQGLTAAAGPGTNVVYQQGLPADTSLPAIPGSALAPAYAPTGLGGSYRGTLTAPETGTYVLAITNPCGCYSPTTLSVDGAELLSDPSTPPVAHLFGGGAAAGRAHLPGPDQRRLVGLHLGDTVRAGTGDRPGGRGGQVGGHGRGRGIRRHRDRGGRPAGPQPAVRAGRAHLGGGGGQPGHRRCHRRGRAGGDAVAGRGVRGGGRLVPR